MHTISCNCVSKKIGIIVGLVGFSVSACTVVVIVEKPHLFATLPYPTKTAGYFCVALRHTPSRSSSSPSAILIIRHVPYTKPYPTDYSILRVSPITKSNQARLPRRSVV